MRKCDFIAAAIKEGAAVFELPSKLCPEVVEALEWAAGRSDAEAFCNARAGRRRHDARAASGAGSGVSRTGHSAHRANRAPLAPFGRGRRLVSRV